jgi:hypothetical protein
MEEPLVLLIMGPAGFLRLQTSPCGAESIQPFAERANTFAVGTMEIFQEKSLFKLEQGSWDTPRRLKHFSTRQQAKAKGVHGPCTDFICPRNAQSAHLCLEVTGGGSGERAYKQRSRVKTVL